MNLPVNALLNHNTKLVSLLIRIEKFHSLFSETAESIPFLSDENINKILQRIQANTHNDNYFSSNDESKY